MTNKPEDLTYLEWYQCRNFAFQFAKQQGYFADIESFEFEVMENSETYGKVAFEQGLNIAIVTCKFWRSFYAKQMADI